MPQPTFRVEVSVDEATGRPIAAYLRVREGEVAETREIQEGVAFADYDARGALLGIEVLGSCQVSVLDHAAEHEPEPIRRFLRGSPPRELVST